MPDVTQESQARTRDVYRFYFGAYPGRTALMVGLMFVAGMAEGIGVVTLVPILETIESQGAPESALSQAVTSVVSAMGMDPTLPVLLGLIVVAMTLKSGMMFLAGKQVGYTVAGVVKDLRIELMSALLGVQWSYFMAHRAGEFANSVATEAHRASVAYRGACQLLAVGLQAIFYLAIATLISWPVALSAVVMGAVFTFLVRRVFTLSRLAGLKQTDAARELAARLVDLLQGIKPIKAMAREGLVWPLLEHETENLNQAQRSEVLASNLLKLFQEPLLTAALAVGIFIPIQYFDATLSTVLVLAFLFYRLVGQVNRMQGFYQMMLVGESAFISLRERSDEAASRREVSTGSRVFEGLEKGVSFEGIEFSYGDHKVLDSVDLRIDAGEFVAVHGESGSGKTTMADLLVGLHRPGGGRILVDGVPLEDFDMTSWRRALGYVPQDVLLFSESILKNVTLGDPSLTRDDAERALRAAGAWSFVEARPGGLDSPIGAISSTLSGGQRQRIAIARALVNNPSILILDEVTTALDPETEREICGTLESLAGEVTIFSISHQHALREVATTTYEMRDGKVEPVMSSAAR